jgi:hypothetical protein
LVGHPHFQDFTQKTVKSPQRMFHVPRGAQKQHTTQ